MRRISVIALDADSTHGAFAPMRRMARGVLGGDARAHQHPFGSEARRAGVETSRRLIKNQDQSNGEARR